MANVPFTQGMGAPSYAAEGQVLPSNSLANLTNLAAAGLSIALVVGVGVWGYKLMMRDVTGLPVVQALSGEMRVRPESPGGQLAQNQGLSVNGVAAAGTAAAPVDKLTLAPKPVEITSEDTLIPATMVAPVQQPAPLDVVEASVELSQTQNTSVEDLVRQLTAGSETIDADDTQSGPKVVAAVVPVAATGVVETPEIQADGVRRSLRPLLRPASAPSVVVPVAVSANNSVTDIDPATIPAGTRLVQLGAFDSPEIARSQWDKLDGRFSDFLHGKSRVVQKAQSGGRTFYRLRAMGFEDLSSARRFCSALLSENADCIPVVTR